MPRYNLHRHVTIPGTGKVVSLRDARKAMAAREAWLGQKPSALRGKINAQRRDFEKLEKAVNAYNETQSFELAGKSAGVSRNTAKTWVLGKKLPKHVSMLWSKKMVGRRKPLAITPERATPFAYVLGAMMGDVSRNYVSLDSKQGRLNLCVRDKGFAEHFSRMLESATGIKTKVVQKGDDFIVDIGSKNIIQLFNELTLYGKRVPREFRNMNSAAKLALQKRGSATAFLKSAGERIAFAQALYDSIGSVRISGPASTKIISIRHGSGEVNDFIVEVLKENGLAAKKRADGYVVIPSAQNWLFMQKIGFRKKTHLDR